MYLLRLEPTCIYQEELLRATPEYRLPLSMLHLFLRTGQALKTTQQELSSFKLVMKYERGNGENMARYVLSFSG